MDNQAKPGCRQRPGCDATLILKRIVTHSVSKLERYLDGQRELWFVLAWLVMRPEGSLDRQHSLIAQRERPGMHSLLWALGLS